MRKCSVLQCKSGTSHLKRHVDACIPKKVTSKIKDIISEPAASDCVSLTTDMWSDDYRKLSYIDVNAFWITKEFVMKNTLLGLKHFGSESHTAVNITGAILYKSFSLEFKKLEASDSPTINLVIPCYYKLHSQLKRIPGDEQPIIVLKQCIMEGLNNKFYGYIKAIH